MDYVFANNRAPLLIGLAATSHSLFANLGALHFGAVPFVQSRQDNAPTTHKQKVILWNFFFTRAAYHFVGSAVVGVLSYGAYALLKPTLTLTRTSPLALLTLGASLASLTILPYTRIRMYGGIRQLQGMLSRGDLDVPGSTKDKESERLIEAWRVQHLVRVVLFTLSWGSAVALLIANEHY